MGKNGPLDLYIRAVEKKKVPLVKKILTAYAHDCRGATAVEYGLLVGIMAIGVAVGTGALADVTNLIFDIILNNTQQVEAGTTTP